MTTNAKIMASVAVFDGARFLFRGVGFDRFAQIWDMFRQEALQVTMGDEATVDRHLKVKVLKHDDGKGGSLRSIFVSGPLADMIRLLPFSYADSLSELHLKCYLVEAFEGAHGAMVDGMYARVTHVAAQLNFFGNKARSGNAKSSGHKGIRIGSRKSDKHAVLYKRVSERTGAETRIKDKLLKRSVAEVKDIVEGMQSMFEDSKCWGFLRVKCGTVGYSAMINSLAEGGIALTDFFSRVSSDPDVDGDVGSLLLKGDQLTQNHLPE